MATSIRIIANDLEKYRMELVGDCIELFLFCDKRLARLERFYEVRSPAPVPYWLVRESFIGWKIEELQCYLAQIQKRHRRLAEQERCAGLPVYIPFFKHHFHDEYTPPKEIKKNNFDDEYTPSEEKKKEEKVEKSSENSNVLEAVWKGLTKKCAKLGQKIVGKIGHVKNAEQ